MPEQPRLVPMSAFMLSAYPTKDQKQVLGDRIFPFVYCMYPAKAAKITGMLIELDKSELLDLLKCRESLKAKVEEAVAVLYRAKRCAL